MFFYTFFSSTHFSLLFLLTAKNKNVCPLKFHTCRIQQVGRIFVAEIASTGKYALADGKFDLPFITLVYTPQCLAAVQCARAAGPGDVDDFDAERLEEAWFHRDTPPPPQAAKKGRYDCSTFVSSH